MKPDINIILLCPGNDELKSGPDESWIQELSGDLALILKKYTGSHLQTITAGGKEAGNLPEGRLLLIPLVHSSYGSSEKYVKLLNKVDQTGRADLNILRIDVSPGLPENIPQAVLASPAVSLFESTSSGGESQWIGEGSGTYWSRLLDVISEIKVLTESGKSEDKQDSKQIYLAQTAEDMGMYRNILKRELLQYGFRVVPEADLNNHAKDLKSYIQNLVDKSRMAIHLLGSDYGDLMKDAGYSVPELQVQYITAYLEAMQNDPVHASVDLQRLIWIDPEFNPVNSSQEEFINLLKRNIENLHRTEIIQTPLELFKTLVIKRLRGRGPGSPGFIPEGLSGDGMYYLIHSPDDQKEAAELAERLGGGGLKLGMLDYSRKQKGLLDEHKKYLRDCDGALIYYGKANRPWLQSKVMDLLKAPGMGRVHAMKSRHILAGKKDMLEDYSLPQGITITRETDMAKSVSQLLKNLKK